MPSGSQTEGGAGMLNDDPSTKSTAARYSTSRFSYTAGDSNGSAMAPDPVRGTAPHGFPGITLN